MLPDGTIVKIDSQNVLDDNTVILVAPKGLEGSVIYAKKKDGTYSKIYQKELKPVEPEDVLKNGRAPEGAKIESKKLVWKTPFIGEGVILSNSMLDDYRIAGIEQIDFIGKVPYMLDFKGDEIIAYFLSTTLVDGTAKIYLIADDLDSVNSYDQLLIVEFKGKAKDSGSGPGCNTIYPLLILVILVPFMGAIRKK
jgi:hypothetical protein